MSVSWCRRIFAVALLPLFTWCNTQPSRLWLWQRGGSTDIRQEASRVGVQPSLLAPWAQSRHGSSAVAFPKVPVGLHSAAGLHQRHKCLMHWSAEFAVKGGSCATVR